eukprot:g599.t1
MKRETNISTLRSKLMSSLLMGSSDESSYKSTNSSSSSSSKQDVKALAVAALRSFGMEAIVDHSEQKTKKEKSPKEIETKRAISTVKNDSDTPYIPPPLPLYRSDCTKMDFNTPPQTAIRMSKAAELMRRATDIRKAAASLAAATAHFDRTSLGSVDRRLKIPGAERFPSVEVSSTSSLSNNGMAGSGYTASSSLRRVRRNLVEESNGILSVGGVRAPNILSVDTTAIRRTSLPRLTSVSPARSSSSPVMRAGFRAGVR